MKTTASHAGHFSLAISQTGCLIPQVASGQLTPWHLRYPQPLPRTKEQPTERVGYSRRILGHKPPSLVLQRLFLKESLFGSRTEILHHSSHSLWAQQSCKQTGAPYAWHMKRDMLPQFLVPISDLKYFFKIPLLPLKGLWPIPQHFLDVGCSSV